MKTNKNTETVFLSVLDTNEKIGKLNKFVKNGNYMDPNENKYKDLIDDIQPKMEELAALEEIILQTRALQNLDAGDIKIIVNNGYIYARAPFYRKDNVAKEIRILLGKTTDWENLEDPILLNIGINALTRAMEKTLYETVDNYKIKFEKQKTCGQ